MGGKIWRAMVAVGLIVFLGGSMSAPSAASTQQATAIVNFGGVLGFTYSPAFIVVSPGDTVEWDGDFSFHPLVSDESLWATQSTGLTFTHTFTSTGVFAFHCLFHGAAFNMKGIVLVALQRIYVPIALREI